MSSGTGTVIMLIEYRAAHLPPGPAVAIAIAQSPSYTYQCGEERIIILGIAALLIDC